MAQGPAFSFQGQLLDAGTPADGSYDLRLIFYDAASGGSQVGATLTNEDVTVSAGLFSTEIDPGSGVLTGAGRWLEIGVRPGDSAGDFTSLGPRQKITSAP